MLRAVGGASRRARRCGRGIGLATRSDTTRTHARTHAANALTRGSLRARAPASRAISSGSEHGSIFSFGDNEQKLHARFVSHGIDDSIAWRFLDAMRKRLVQLYAQTSQLRSLAGKLVQLAISIAAEDAAADAICM